MTTRPDTDAVLPPRELANLRIIDRLNQRGGRMLSVVDLLEAGSLNLEMAAYLLRRVSAGASFLTAASPGGAGKTAVMGALLGLTPPGSVLREVWSRRDISDWSPDPTTTTWHVCHEMGSGGVPGYLWGAAVPDYFGLMAPGSYLASNLHADTVAEVHQALCSAPNDLPPDLLGHIELVLTLRVDRTGGATRHRCAAICAATPGGRWPLYTWDEDRDDFRRTDDAPLADDLGEAMEFLAGSRAEGIRELAPFRSRLLAFLGDERRS